MPEMLVPAYVHWREEATWARIIAAKPGIVVINPNNGPDASQGEPYARVVKLLRTARSDVRVLGYIWCAHFDRRMRSIRADASIYQDSYDLDGIFWDGVPTTNDGLTRRRLRGLAGTVSFSVFNCGVPVPPKWFSMLPDAVFATFEGSAEDYRAPLESHPRRACHLVHGAGPAAPPAAQSDLGYFFITDGRLPNPWCTF